MHDCRRSPALNSWTFVTAKSALRALFVLVMASLVSPGESGAEDQRRYVPVLTNPTLNESPEILTELRLYHIYNKVPQDFISNGGGIGTVGLQARYALSERLALILTKVGYSSASFESLLTDDSGMLNIAAGAKYALVAVPKRSRYLTVGARYEAPVGDIRSGIIELQGGGDGLIDMFVSWGSEVGDRAGIQGSAGVNMAIDSEHDSSTFHSSAHVDYEVVDDLFGVLEANLVSTIEDGSRTDSSILGGFEGFDLFNAGATSSGTVATLGLGARFAVGENLHVGAAYEFPVTSNEGFVDFRTTVDAVLSF